MKTLWGSMLLRKLIGLFGLLLVVVAHGSVGQTADEVSNADTPVDVCRLQLIEEEAEALEPLAKAAIAFVRKNSAIPSEAELASQARVSVDEVRGFFMDEGNPKNPLELVQQTKQYFPAVFEGLQKKVLVKWNTVFRKELRRPSIPELARALGTREEHFTTLYGTLDEISDRAGANQGTAGESVRKKILKAYASGSQQRRETLSLEELALEAGVEIEEAQTWFGTGPGALFANLQELKLAAVEAHPKSFVYVEDRDIFTPERKAKLVDALRTRKRAIVTTAIAGVSLHEEALAALRNMAQRLDAEVFIIPANMEVFFLDPKIHELEGVHVLTEDLELGPDMMISTLEIIGKMIRPSTGLLQRGKRGQVQIYGSPKLWVETVASLGENEYPHIKVWTGAITQGSYRGGTATSQRTNRFGEEDHVLGAVVLEKSSGENRLLPEAGHGYFHFRHVEYRKRADGSWGFLDLGKFYTSESVAKAKGNTLSIEAHVGDTDQAVLEQLSTVFKKVPVSMVVVHDIFNGHSINGHERDRLVTRGKTATSGRSNLEGEIRGVVSFLDTILSYGTGYVVRIDLSNHDQWLVRYLQSGEWIRDSENYVFASQLNLVLAQGGNPLEWAIAKIARERFGRDILKRVRFMKPGEELKIGEDAEDVLEVGQHGDIGNNGARGSIGSAVQVSKRSMSGHTHTYRRQNAVVQIPTLTKRRLDYNAQGASNWVQGVGLAGPDNSMQVLVFVDGELFSSVEETRPPEEFFYEGYPKVVPRPPFAGYGGSLDPTSAFKMLR